MAGGAAPIPRRAGAGARLGGLGSELNFAEKGNPELKSSTWANFRATIFVKFLQHFKVLPPISSSVTPGMACGASPHGRGEGGRKKEREREKEGGCS